MNQNIKKSRTKLTIIVLCLLMAIVLTIGSIFAFFSDVVTGTESMTAGTLDLDASVAFYINGSTNEASEDDLACINPGDVVQVVVTATNTGSKSAWLKGEFTISGADKSAVALTSTQLSSVFTVKDSASAAVTVSSGTNVITFDSDVVILDGSYEEETATGAVESTSTTLTYYITFDAAAGNAWQNSSISIGYSIKALQYKNNPSPNWSSAVALT